MEVSLENRHMAREVAKDLAAFHGLFLTTDEERHLAEWFQEVTDDREEDDR